jgi:hypothetical protein
MANVKITDLTAYTDPLNTDVLAIVDVTNNVTKKVSIANMAKNVSLGTAALPGVAFDGDPNTGISSPGADQLAISTNGTGRLFVDATGNVGVGAASPSAWSYGGNITIPGAGRYVVSTADDIRFAANVYSSDVDRYVANGFATRYRMSDGTHQWTTAVTGVAGNAITYNESMRITAGGLVGIGSSSPGALLSVEGNSASSAIGFAGRFYDTATNRGFGAPLLYVRTPNDTASSSAIGMFGVGDNADTSELGNLFRITQTGLVGINTTSPGSIFHVKPATDENIRFSGGSGDTRIACFNDAASSTVQLSIQASPLLFRGTGGAEVGRWDSSGRLLVGTFSGNANGGILQLSSGITFPATAVAASDVNTLDDYEEGTWTPIDSSGAGLTFTSTTGSYTKIGNLCYVSGSLTFPSTANASSAIIGGLPFNPSAATQYLNYGPPIRNDKSLSMHVFGLQNTTFFLLPIGNYTTYITNLQMSNGTMLFSHTYQTA